MRNLRIGEKKRVKNRIDQSVAITLIMIVLQTIQRTNLTGLHLKKYTTISKRQQQFFGFVRLIFTFTK